MNEEFRKYVEETRSALLEAMERYHRNFIEPQSEMLAHKFGLGLDSKEEPDYNTLELLNNLKSFSIPALFDVYTYIQELKSNNTKLVRTCNLLDEYEIESDEFKPIMFGNKWDELDRVKSDLSDIFKVRSDIHSEVIRLVDLLENEHVYNWVENYYFTLYVIANAV